MSNFFQEAITNGIMSKLFFFFNDFKIPETSLGVVGVRKIVLVSLSLVFLS